MKKLLLLGFACVLGLGVPAVAAMAQTAPIYNAEKGGFFSGLFNRDRSSAPSAQPAARVRIAPSSPSTSRMPTDEERFRAEAENRARNEAVRQKMAAVRLAEINRRDAEIAARAEAENAAFQAEQIRQYAAMGAYNRDGAKPLPGLEALLGGAGATAAAPAAQSAPPRATLYTRPQPRDPEQPVRLFNTPRRD